MVTILILHCAATKLALVSFLRLHLNARRSPKPRDKSTTGHFMLLSSVLVKNKQHHLTFVQTKSSGFFSVMWSVFSEPVDEGVLFNADPLSSAMCFIFLLVCNFNMFNGTIGRCLTTNNNRRRGMMMMIEELIYTHWEAFGFGLMDYRLFCFFMVLMKDTFWVETLKK